MKRRVPWWQTVVALAVLLGLSYVGKHFRGQNAPPDKGPVANEPARRAAEPAKPSTLPPARGAQTNDKGARWTFKDEAALLNAIREKKSDLLVRFEAKVRKTLPDDRDGDQHQRFLVDMKGGQTLLIAHNIDLAPRVPVDVGDLVTISGEYEWNEQGGVVHWTHHDPGQRRADGSIEHKGKVYK